MAYVADDTKAATRRSPNCIRKTKTTFCRTQVSVPFLPKFYEKLLPYAKFTEIGQSADELWPKKTIFNMAAVRRLVF